MQLQEQVELAPYTTLAIGGTARYFVSVHALEELHEACAFSKEHSLAVNVMGGGSNMLFPDEGLSGLVVHTALKGIDVKEKGHHIKVRVAAGEDWDSFVSYCVEKKWWGIENLSGIPGYVGATPIQNVGAYGVEVSEVIEYVEAMDFRTGEMHLLSKEACAFAYRDSFFKSEEGRNFIVTCVGFILSKTPHPIISYRDVAACMTSNAPSIAQMRECILSIRSGKFPDWNVVGTAGSFFKNPIVEKKDAERLQQKYPDIPRFETSDGRVKLSLAWILDNVCNLKGFEKDGVGLFEKQPLILVAKHGVSSNTVKSFVAFVTEQVEQRTGIRIESEVHIL